MAIAANTTALWNLEADETDSSNGYTVTNTTSIPFTTVATCDCAGSFGSTDRFVAPAGFNSAIASLTAWTIELNFRFTTAASPANPWIWNIETDHHLYMSSAGNLVTQKGGVFSISSNTFAINAWYYVSVTYDGTSMKTRWRLRSASTDPVLVGTATGDGSVAASPAFLIGNRQLFDKGWSGYISNFRFSDVARTSWPTVDPPDPLVLTTIAIAQHVS